MSNTELLTTSNMNPIEVFKTGGSDLLIASIRKQALAFAPDVTTAKGRKEIASVAHKVGKSGVVCEDAGKAQKKVHKDACDVIDGERKKIRAEFSSLKEEILAPLTLWKAEEQKKADAEELRLKLEEDARLAEEARLAEVARLAEEARLKVIADEQEARNKELEAREAELKAKEDESIRIAHEAELVKQAELKAKSDAEQTVNQAKEAEQRAKFEKEQALKQAELDKAEAVKRAEWEQEQALIQERARVQKEADRQAELAEQERIKAEKKANNKAHIKKVAEASCEALMEHVFDLASPSMARDIITAIHQGKIPNVTINY